MMQYLSKLIKSIFIISLPKLPKVNGCMAKSTIFELEFLNLSFIHFMLASLAAIIIASDNWLSRYNTSWEIAAARPTNSVILADWLLAVSSRALDSLSWCFLWWMFGKDAHCYVHVTLFFLLSTHSLQLDECSRTLFVTLNRGYLTLL